MHLQGSMFRQMLRRMRLAPHSLLWFPGHPLMGSCVDCMESTDQQFYHYCHVSDKKERYSTSFPLERSRIVLEICPHWRDTVAQYVRAQPELAWVLWESGDAPTPQRIREIVTSYPDFDLDIYFVCPIVDEGVLEMTIGALCPVSRARIRSIHATCFPVDEPLLRPQPRGRNTVTPAPNRSSHFEAVISAINRLDRLPYLQEMSFSVEGYRLQQPPTIQMESPTPPQPALTVQAPVLCRFSLFSVFIQCDDYMRRDHSQDPVIYDRPRPAGPSELLWLNLDLTYIPTPLIHQRDIFVFPNLQSMRFGSAASFTLEFLLQIRAPRLASLSIAVNIDTLNQRWWSSNRSNTCPALSALTILGPEASRFASRLMKCIEVPLLQKLALDANNMADAWKTVVHHNPSDFGAGIAIGGSIIELTMPGGQETPGSEGPALHVYNMREHIDLGVLRGFPLPNIRTLKLSCASICERINGPVEILSFIQAEMPATQTLSLPPHFDFERLQYRYLLPQIKKLDLEGIIMATSEFIATLDLFPEVEELCLRIRGKKGLEYIDAITAQPRSNSILLQLIPRRGNLTGHSIVPRLKRLKVYHENDHEEEKYRSLAQRNQLADNLYRLIQRRSTAGNPIESLEAWAQFPHYQSWAGGGRLSELCVKHGVALHFREHRSII